MMALLDEKTNATVDDEILVLIPEARMRRRRRWLRAMALSVFVSAAVFLTFLYVGGFWSQPSTPRSTIPASAKNVAAPLPLGTVINASSVVAIQMFTSTKGVAISTFWDKKFDNIVYSYLTRTSNGGSSWRITGVLPAGSWNQSGESSGQFAFVTTREGYIAQPAPREPLFTSNGGRTWQHVTLAGVSTSLWLTKGGLVASTERCPSGWADTNRCVTHVDTFAIGSLKPTKDDAIPSASSGSTRVPPGVLAWFGSTGVAVENSTLETTSDAGVTWRRVISPNSNQCPGEVQLTSSSHWYMLCGRGVGMMKAYNWLYATTDSGRTWALVAEGSPLRDVGGSNIGPYAVSAFGVSSDGREMWLDGGPGFLEVSSDGGHHWRFAGTIGAKTNITGPYFVSVGHEVWMPIEFGGLLRSTNASTWNVVAESSFP